MIVFLERMTNFERFLNQKPLFYQEIDYDRMPRVWQKIKHHFTLPKVIVHIVGTNGKGSTGRFISHFLHKKGLRVGHYSSPHILRFNERIWVDGQNVSDEKLQGAHEALLAILSAEDAQFLSYFEYTTLLGMWIFGECDYLIMEAGLGGEHDATAVFESRLTVATMIGHDHHDFLGDTIEQIAETKLKATKNCLLLGKQYDSTVKEIAQSVTKAQGTLLCHYHPKKEVEEIVKRLSLPEVFCDNFSLAFCALEMLGFEFESQLMDDLQLFGRVYKIAENITIDVGHNPMAAEALLKHFQKQQQKIVLIFNSYDDKDFSKSLEILKPIVERVEIIRVENERITEREKLESVLKALEIPYCDFERVDHEKNNLVFGSFRVVEAFLHHFESRK